jgi:hypothetical protein
MAAYLEARLSPQEKAAFEEHVSECASCQEILALSMKLQGQEDADQTAGEQTAGKRILFRFSIPIPVLGGVFIAFVLIAVLFRILGDSSQNLSRPQSAELHMPAQGTETVARNAPAPVTLAEKGNSAPEKPRTETRIPEEKAKVTLSSGLKAEIESPSPAVPAVEAEAAKTSETATREMAASGASPEGLRSATMPSPAAAPGRLEDRQAATALKAPTRDMIFGLREGRPELGAAESRQIRDKSFYFSLGYWIDRQCEEHRDDPIIEISPAVPEYGPILARYPELRDLLPAMVRWDGRNYLLR